MAKYAEEEAVESSEENGETVSESEHAISALLLTQSEPRSKKRKRESSGGVAQESASSSKRKESDVWRFFDRNEDKTKSCRICNKKFSSNTATGALRKHLGSHFGDQNDAILSSAQIGKEIIVNPTTNTLTISGMPHNSLLANTIITTSQSRAKRGRRSQQPKQDPVVREEEADTDPKKQRLKSAVWMHFKRHEDGRPECLHCNYFYSSTASTSGLRRHAEMHERERNGEAPVKGRKGRKATGKASPAGNRLPRLMNGNAMLGEDYFLKLMIRGHISKSEIADQFSAVYQIATGKIANPDVLNSKLKALFARKKEEVTAYLAQYPSKISLSLETWKSTSGHDYMIVTAHLLTDNWDPLRFVMDCVLLSPDVQAESIKDHLIAILEESQCSGKVLAIATDNSGIINQAMKLFKTSIANQGGAEFARVHCIGIGLAECVKPVLDSVANPINKLRRFMKVLLNNRKIVDLQTQSALNLQDYYELKLDSPAFWYSTISMLDAVVKMKGVIDDFITRNEGMFEVFSSDDWISLELILELVGNFQLAAQDVHKTDYPTLSIALPLVEYLTTHLATQKERADVPAWFKKAAKEMLDRTNKLLQSLLTDVHFFGTVLDPRHKLSTIPAATSRQVIEESLRTTYTLYLQPATPTPSNDVVSNKVGSIMTTIFKKTQAVSVLPQLDELNQYLSTAVEVPDTDPTKWWENYRKVYPNLALMAKDYIAVPATSLPSDQLFDQEKAVGKWRNRSSDVEDVLMNICLKSWIDLEFVRRH